MTNNTDSSSNNTTIKQPIWVELALSSISKRQHAVWLIMFSIVCTIGLAIWWLAFDGDWTWFAWTAPLPVWYALSARWMDKNSAWEAR